jgi:hypothetical protein
MRRIGIKKSASVRAELTSKKTNFVPANAVHLFSIASRLRRSPPQTSKYREQDEHSERKSDSPRLGLPDIRQNEQAAQEKPNPRATFESMKLLWRLSNPR